MSIEIHDGSPWIFRSRSCGELPDAPLHEVLRWVVEQLHFGHFVVEHDDRGDGVSLTLGQAAAFARPIKANLAHEYEEMRNRALTVAGIFAAARERGVEPQYADLSDKANSVARNNDTGQMNTDFYYAFELVSLLRRLAKTTFLFEAPPILGQANATVIEMLGEATRCFLFGLFRSSTSVCRACMEAVLRSAVRPDQLLNEVWKTKRGEIESLINVALREGILTEPFGGAAHRVRQVGNDAAHGKQLSAEVSWEVLQHTRQIAEQICGRA